MYKMATAGVPSGTILAVHLQKSYICQPDAEIFGDGTFKYCPRYFYQLYTLLGYKNGHYVPCVFFLLPSKSGECYTNMCKKNRVSV
jgi:hypothetical protein